MKRVISSYWLVAVIFIFSLAVLPWKEAFSRQVFITIQFITIGIISGIGIIHENRIRPYSLVMVHWFFIFSFMFCAGITQFANSSYRWGLMASDSIVEKGNWIILIWETTFALASIIRIHFKKPNLFKLRNAVNHNGNIRLFVFTISILALLVIGVMTFVRGGYTVFFNRTVYGKSTIISSLSNSSLRLIANALITGFCMWSTVTALSLFKEKKTPQKLILVLMTFIVLLLNVPPTAVPRYEAAAVYGGIIVSSWKSLKRNNAFFYLLAIGLLIVFPLLNSFRGTMYGTITIEAINNSLGSIGTNFLRADYDAYSMLLYTIRYVEQLGITHGMQLIGALLFFIPSSIWKGKPGGSGALIINSLASDYNSNVSCPMPAEGYINFGIIGVIFFALVFSLILHSQDRKYWKKNEEEQEQSMLFSCALPFTLFMLRGDLMSTMAFFIGFSVSLWLYRKSIYRKA